MDFVFTFKVKCRLSNIIVIEGGNGSLAQIEGLRQDPSADLSIGHVALSLTW